MTEGGASVVVVFDCLLEASSVALAVVVDAPAVEAAALSPPILGAETVGAAGAPVADPPTDIFEAFTT